MPVFWKETASSGPPPLEEPPAKEELWPDCSLLPPPLSQPLEPLEHAPKRAAAATRHQTRLMLQSVDDARRGVNPGMDVAHAMS